MREIVLDTETTGLDPNSGHRLVEIACLEIFNCVPTGKVFHTYLNPEREVPQDAAAVHGLTTQFLRDHPKFKEKADEFMDFLGDTRLVIHNAPFDLKFLNAELGWLKKPLIDPTRATDTLTIARKKFPGAKNNLDALCKRFNIDNSHRTYHGALLDTELLVEVYVELLGGKQREFGLHRDATTAQTQVISLDRAVRPARTFAVDASEREAHEKLLEGIKNPLWKQG